MKSVLGIYGEEDMIGWKCSGVFMQDLFLDQNGIVSRISRRDLERSLGGVSLNEKLDLEKKKIQCKKIQPKR